MCSSILHRSALLFRDMGTIRSLRRRWAVGMAVLGFATVVSAQGPILSPGDALAFDYYDSDFSTYAVTSFQASWDSGTSWTVLVIVAFTDQDTVEGATSYQFIPPFKNGQHSVILRACNAQGCGGGSVPFDFAYAVSNPVPLAVPGNVRKVTR
jgi:hypothetical protein